MRLLHENVTTKYRDAFTRENLGWTILSNKEQSFLVVHRVEMHPEDGPVIVLEDFVYEVTEEDPIFASRETALDAYYSELQNEVDTNGAKI